MKEFFNKKNKKNNEKFGNLPYSPYSPHSPKIHRLKITRACCGLRVAGKRGRTLKNRGTKTKQKFFTSQLVTRNSQSFPPGSKKLAVDFGHLTHPNLQ
jgi:hypothetical protein